MSLPRTEVLLMRTVVELNEEDIIKTIANAFDVDAKNVVLEYKEVWKGYGPNEYQAKVAKATVVLKSGGAAAGTD